MSSMIEQGVPVEEMTFVVRAAGERTEVTSVATLRARIAAAGGDPHGQVHVVHERPFSAAVGRTLEVGMQQARPYVIGMDADVLLSPRGVQSLGVVAANMTRDTYSMSGLMLCRFYGGYCFRGVHVYQAHHLEKARGLLGRSTPGGPDPALKPETALVEAMKAEGYAFSSLPLPLGIHDFEQSYLHIYLKMRLRARRELEIDGGEKGLQGLVQWCRARAAGGDPDFVVALWGLDDGTAESRRARAAGTLGHAMEQDWFARWPEFEERMLASGLREKPPLQLDDALGLPDRVMGAHVWEGDVRTPKWIKDRLAGRAAEMRAA